MRRTVRNIMQCMDGEGYKPGGRQFSISKLNGKLFLAVAISVLYVRRENL